MERTTTTYTPTTGAEIRARREALSMTRAELVGRSGCSLAFVASVETGAVPKHSAAVARLLEALAEAEREARS